MNVEKKACIEAMRWWPVTEDGLLYHVEQGFLNE
jgi:hypothetical protein